MYTHLLQNYRDKLPGWSLAAIKNTLLMVSLLLEEKTVNLWKLKGAVGKVLGNTETDSRSHYQRLKRWLRLGSDTRQVWVGMLQASASLLTQSSLYLVLDGSSWISKGRKYHFLTLSVLYQGVSIPVWWLELGKLGVSSDWERRLLLKLAKKLFKLQGKVLLADREYVGQTWFKTLHEARIDFVIRMRENIFHKQIQLKGKSVSKLENQAKTRLGKPVWKRFELDGYQYYYVLVAYKTKSGKLDFVRLITTLTPAKAVAGYAKRYRIESMFRHLKSNGFDLESLNVKQAGKINMMMAALVLAYTLAVVEGLKKFKRCIALKKHGWPEMSVFRFGLDLWQNSLTSFNHFISKIYKDLVAAVRRQNKAILLNVP